jgi:hypothetical protein
MIEALDDDGIVVLGKSRGTVSRGSQVDELHVGAAICDRQPRATRFEIESPRARSSRIDDETVVRGPEHQPPVRVTVHEDVARVPGEQQLRPGAADFVAVAHMDCEPAHAKRALSGETRVLPVIDISRDGFDRGDLRQLPEDLLTADVARVDDEIDTRHRGPQLRPEEAVRVRDEADHERRF